MDNGGWSWSNVLLVCICFPWAVALLLDQAGLLDPALDAFFLALEGIAKGIGLIVGGL